MRAEFSIPNNLIYLNSGTVAFSPKSVLKSEETKKKWFEENPAQGFMEVWGEMWQAQKDLASFFKANPQEIFLRTNVTYAMNDFLMALNLPKGSEILISNLEYGAVINICRYKAQLEGHTIKIMNLPTRGKELEKFDEKKLLSLFQSELTKKTKLVMFSHVTTGAGFRFPIEKIAEICRAEKIVFAVDGAHGAGSIDLDFSKTKIDFYGSNLHKWMMGPKGTGFGWVSPQVREKLQPKFAGWTTYDTHPLFSTFGGGDPWTIRWMICSTHNFSDFLGISENLNFWKKHGVKNILGLQKKLRDFSARIISQKTRWPCISNFNESFVGPMLAFDLPTNIASRGLEVMAFLKKEYQLQVGMTMVDGLWCVRIAPHIYNSEKEIERAAEILATSL